MGGGGGKNAIDSRNDCFRFRKRVRFKKNDSTNESIEWLKRDTSCSFQPVQKKQHGSGTGRHNGNKMARSTAPLFSFSILPYLLRRSRSTNFRALFLRLEKGRGGGKEKRKKKKEEKKKKKNVSSTAGKKSWDLSNPYPPSKMTTCEKLVTTRDNTFITTRIADCRLFSIPGEKKREDFNRWAQRTIPSDVDHQSHAEAAVSNCPPPSHRHPPSSDSTSVYVRVLCAVFFSRVDDKPIGGYK